MKAVAYAWYQDPYAGQLPAYLKPYRPIHKKRFSRRYQWQTDRGTTIGEPLNNPFVLIERAMRNPAFSYVSCDIELGGKIIHINQ